MAAWLLIKSPLTKAILFQQDACHQLSGVVLCPLTVFDDYAERIIKPAFPVLNIVILPKNVAP
ncbi:hypothetical protein BN1183_AX_00560 [Pantoea ananatis]|nr:hypothetical protein BN1183_AX_00560 [Pantoea ananatis]